MLKETEKFCKFFHKQNIFFGCSEWLMRRTCDQHGLGSKPTRTILLCTWERHFTALSPAWWSWQATKLTLISLKKISASPTTNFTARL